MKNAFKILFVSVTVAFSMDVYSQGCSDAGFCTVHSIKTNAPVDFSENFKNQFKVGFSYGMAQNKIAIYTPYSEFTRKIGAKTAFTVKVLYAVHHGDLAASDGFSDVILTVNYHFVDNLQFIAGTKIPFNDANKQKNELSLPMAYQTSLGSTDMILGLNFHKNYFSITTAYQQPFIQNKNGFDISDYSEETLRGIYYSTNNWFSVVHFIY